MQNKFVFAICIGIFLIDLLALATGQITSGSIQGKTVTFATIVLNVIGIVLVRKYK